MATVAADENRDTTEDEPMANRARPWIAGALSIVVPGLGQAYARRYLRALVWFSPIVVALVVGAGAVDLSLRGLVGVALDSTVLWGLFWLNIATAAWRIASAVDAFAQVQTKVSRSVGATALTVGWLMLALLVVVPHIVIGRYTLDALSLVETVFVADDATAPVEPVFPIGTDADIVPDPAVASTGTDSEVEYQSVFDSDMWDPEAVTTRIGIEGNRTAAGQAPFLPFNERVGERRITILIAGGDAGPGRGGLRTDSMIVASIHTGTGKAALFSFPRNLGSIPLPKRFEGAFEDFEKSLAPEPAPVEEGEEIPEWESCKCFPEQMNSIYPFTRRWTRTYPNEIDPGMAALRDVIEGLMGVNIDYYMLVDMAAFVDLVDAIGGIDVNVLQPLQAEVSPPREGDPWATVDVDVGWNHLDGSQALAYARARKGSSDYARMERQRCMLRGVAAKADPFSLLRSFPAIVDALENSVVTDIPRSFASEFIATAANLEFSDIETVGFTHAYWLAERDHLYHPIPDVGRIRSKVRRIFSGQDSGDIVESGESECDA
jgi:LCP family protein required for cell wall assembly